MNWSLNLYESTKFWTVVFDIESTMFILVDIGMKPAYRYVMNSYVRIVGSSKPYFVSIVEVNDV